MVNGRTGDILFAEVIRADGIRERAKGLLGTGALPLGRALVLAPARQIHTFGMRYPIDVVFCDREMNVLGVHREVPPNRLTRVHWGARCVIECAAGGAAGIQIGDVLEIQPMER